MIASTTNAQTQISVRVGDKQFPAAIENSATGQAFLALLPMTLNMNELNGNEKYYYLSSNLPTDSYKPGTIQEGDILLYGNNCVVLFYKTFSSSYSYTRIGRLTDTNGLQAALGSGDVTVSFVQEGTTAIDQTESEKAVNSQCFNLLGQRVSDDYHGIVIQNGQKRIQ